MNSRILPTLALFVAIGIFFGYVRQTWIGEIAATKTAIASDDSALAAAGKYSAQQNELASARNAIDQVSINRLAVLLPDSVDNVGLILDLNALAARNGISISNIDVMSDTKNSENAMLSAAAPSSWKNPVGSIDLSLSAAGSYASLQNFLKEVEKSQRLLDIRDITVKGSDTGVYNYHMTLRLYWLR